MYSYIHQGKGGMALFWRNNSVNRLTILSSDKVMVIKIRTSGRPLCVVATYLSCHSGCTDPFKGALDYLDNVISQLSFNSNAIVLGDQNADLGGPLATNTRNKIRSY